MTRFQTHRAQPPIATREPITNLEDKIPLTMVEVLDRVRQRTGDWPRRVGDVLFVHGEHGVNWLTSTSATFGWLQASTGRAPWHKSVGCVTKEEVVAELRRTSQRYEAVEELPHEPQLAGHYYACPEIEPGDGSALNAFLDWFAPATPIDRDLILAALLSLFWGGHGGSRPAFMVTSDDGRGVGKSKVAELLASVAGGVMSFSANEPIDQIKTRLLSAEGLTKRVALLDNVKSLKFSWAELEALITAPIISGKRMYCGEGQRPNTLTWFITLNGASLSTDLAQRCVPIKLVRPTYSGCWEEALKAFVEANRQAIIADIIGRLRQPSHQLEHFTRWSTWEQHVLARLPEPSEAQRVIQERQGETDVERDEADLIQEFFAEQLTLLGYDPQNDRVLVPSQEAAKWLNECTNETRRGVVAAGRMLNQAIDERKLPRLRRNACKTWGRGVVWEGEQAELTSTVWTDLERRRNDQRDRQGR